MATTAVVTATSAAEDLRKGYVEITLSNWTTGAKPLLRVGSVFEMGGTMYKVFTADEDTDPAAAWAGFAAGWVYGYAAVALGVITPEVSTTAPTWDTDKQGFYDATGLKRCLYSFDKDAGANWTNKTILYTRESSIIPLGLRVGGHAADSDRLIRFASDTTIAWNETLDNFLANKNVARRSTVFTTLAAVTEATLYAQLSGWIPTTTGVGSIFPVSGAGILTVGGNQVIFSGVIYASATSLTLYYFNVASGLVGTYTIRSGNATVPFSAGTLGAG